MEFITQGIRGLKAFREIKVLLSLLLKYIISTRFHLQFIEWSTYNSMLYKNFKLTKKIFSFFTLAKFREAHRVTHQDKQRALEYFENHAVVYSKKVTKGPLSLLRNIERNAVLKFAKLDEPGASMIDMGTGSGFYALKAKEAGMIVHAMDASPGMLSLLQDRVDRLYHADIDSFQIKKTFDRVVCAGVLDFVINPEVALKNLCQLVAPGGRLVILVPRNGLGGQFYRLEKLILNTRVNLYSIQWLESKALVYGLHLMNHAKPLPTNLVALFERPRTDIF